MHPPKHSCVLLSYPGYPAQLANKKVPIHPKKLDQGKAQRYIAALPSKTGCHSLRGYDTSF